MYEYKGIIERVVDGDTIDVDVDLGFDVHIKQRFRLARINAPEVKTPEGVEAKRYAQIFTGVHVRLVTGKYDKYGRYIAEVFVSPSTEINNTQMKVVFTEKQASIEINMNDHMVATDHAIYQTYK